MAKKKKERVVQGHLEYAGVRIWSYDFDTKAQRVVAVRHNKDALAVLFERVTKLKPPVGVLTEGDTANAVLRWGAMISDPRYRAMFGVGAPTVAALDVVLGALRRVCERCGYAPAFIPVTPAPEAAPMPPQEPAAAALAPVPSLPPDPETHTG